MPADRILKEKLNKANNLGDIFRELNEHYDLDKTPVGFISRNVLLQKIDGIVDYLQPPRKKNSIGAR